MKNRLVYVGTVVGMMVLWYWAYVRPMDEARAAVLDCMNDRGEIDEHCANSKGKIATNTRAERSSD